MIKCPNCQADNQLGAIFCRECGERINIEDLRPDDIDKATKKGKSFKAIVSGLRSLVGVVILLALLAALGSIFLKPGYSQPLPLKQPDVEVVHRRLARLMRGPGEFAFSQAEATQIAKEMTFLTERDRIATAGEDSGFGLVPVDITVNFMTGNRVKLILKSRLMDKISVYSVLEGRVEGSAGQGLVFRPVDSAFGRLPMPFKAGIDVIAGRFQRLLDSNPQRFDKFREQVMKRSSEARIEVGKITLRK